MRLTIEAHDLPGRTCRGHADVHVGIQVGREPAHLVPADAPSARWQVELDVFDGARSADSAARRFRPRFHVFPRETVT